MPVSCVEQGRWDHRRHDEPFAPAPQAAHPQLRRLKNERVRESLGGGEAPRADQQEVWAEVAAKSTRHGVASDTGALHDVFEERREPSGARRARGIDMKCSQVGMLAAIGGRFVVLDYVSDVEAFAALHDPLVAGYALDALDAARHRRRRPFARRRARLPRADARPRPWRRVRAVGLGEGLRFDFGGLAGTGLQADGELVAVTAFGGR